MGRNQSSNVKKYQHRLFRRKSNEQRVSAAAESWHRQEQLGGPLSIAATAREFSVSKSTLRARLRGVQPKTESAKSRQLVPEPIEDTLVAWADYWSSEGRPVSMRRLQLKAELLIGKKCGRRWRDNLLLRHPNLCTGKPSGLDPKRAQAFNRHKLDYKCLSSRLSDNTRT